MLEVILIAVGVWATFNYFNTNVADIPQEVLTAMRTSSSSFGVPVALLLAIGKHESGFKQNVTGKAGEIGIMQILPSTGADLGFSVADLKELQGNTNCAAMFLSKLLTKYKGKIADVIAAYNAGKVVLSSGGLYFNLNYVLMVYSYYTFYSMRRI